jgi:hypothetical protein
VASPEDLAVARTTSISLARSAETRGEQASCPAAAGRYAIAADGGNPDPAAVPVLALLPEWTLDCRSTTCCRVAGVRRAGVGVNATDLDMQALGASQAAIAGASIAVVTRPGERDTAARDNDAALYRRRAAAVGRAGVAVLAQRVVRHLRSALATGTGRHRARSVVRVRARYRRVQASTVSRIAGIVGAKVPVIAIVGVQASTLAVACIRRTSVVIVANVPYVDTAAGDDNPPLDGGRRAAIG